jgi:hypothetical protein
LLAGASTPWTEPCKRDAGTGAASRLSIENGSRSIATVLSENGFLSVIRTSPSGSAHRTGFVIPEGGFLSDRGASVFS